MKKILIPWLCLFSFYSLADQVDLLAQQRDHYLENGLSLLKKYCPESNEYVCRQQLEIDCSHGVEAKKKLACSELEKIKQLEKSVLSADKNLEQIAHVDLPSFVPPKLEIPPLIEKQILTPLVPGATAYHEVSIKLGASIKMAREQGAPSDEIKSLLSKFEKVKGQKIRVDCDKKEDCRYQVYGNNPCGGPDGYFAYSTKGGESAKRISEVVNFSAAQQAFVKKWNVGIVGLCAYFGPSDEVGCDNNVCR
jgi:hypothetical protein